MISIWLALSLCISCVIIAFPLGFVVGVFGAARVLRGGEMDDRVAEHRRMIASIRKSGTLYD